MDVNRNVLTMTGGTIAGNLAVNTSEGKGGAVYIVSLNGGSFETSISNFELSGTTASIPSTGIRNNDIYLVASTIKINGNLGNSFATKITSSAYSDGKQVLEPKSNSDSDIAYITNNFTKFSLTNLSYYIISNGTMFSAPSVQSVTAFVSGNTYAACSQADLLEVASKVSAGTDCSGVTIQLAGNVSLNNSYTGIGTSSKPFKGTFDGNHKTVSFNNSKSGIFNYVEGAVISAVKTTGTIKSTNSSDSLGAIAGTLKTSGTISLCANYASVTYEGSQSGYCNTGGIVGSCDNSNGSNSDVIIDQCKNWGTVTANIGNYGTGGIVGQGCGVTIKNCENFGAVNNTGSSNPSGTVRYGIAGGIVGEPHINGGKTNIYNCANNGNITSSGYAGGIIGGRGTGTIKNSWANCTVTSSNDQAGGISGQSGQSIDNCFVRTATTIYPNVTEATGCTIITSSVATIMNSLNTQATANSWKEWYTNDGRLTIKSNDTTWNDWMSTQ